LQARPKDGRALSSGSENQIDTDLALIADEIARLAERDVAIPAESNSAQYNIDQSSVTSSDLYQNTAHHLEQRIRELIRFGDYEKAIRECGNFLDHDPHSSLINLLMVIAALKGRGANRHQTRTVKRLEKHLSHSCEDPSYYPTAIVIWGLIKHDHYKLNALHQEKPTLNDLKEALAKINLEEIDLDLIEKIRASQQAYEYLNLLRFFNK
jgi:hypothetical protein